MYTTGSSENKKKKFVLIELPHPTDARYGPDESIEHIVYQGKSGGKFAIYMSLALRVNVITNVIEMFSGRELIAHCCVPRKNRPLTSTTWVSGTAVQKPECAHLLCSDARWVRAT